MKKASLLILFLTVFIDLLGFGIVLPLLPYYAHDFGANAFGVGALLAIYSLMQLFFSPLWGRLSDRIGRRPVLMLSLFGSALGLTAFGSAYPLARLLSPEHWQPLALALLFVSRAFSGVMAATISIAQAYITDATTPENRAKGMGIIGAAFGLGFLFGPALGGVFAHVGAGYSEALRYGLPAYIAAGIALLNLLFATFKLPESLPEDQRGQEQVRGVSFKRLAAAAQVPGLGRLMLIYFLTIFAFATMEATFPLLTMDHFKFTEVQNGYVFAYIGVLVVLLQGGLVGRLAKRFGERALIIAGALSLAVALALLPFAPTVGVMLLVLVPLAVGNGLCNPNLTSLISKTAEAGAKGATLGAGQSMAALGRVLGPLWGGFAYAYLGSQPSYLVAGAIMFVLAGVALGIRKPEPANEAPVAEATTAS